MPPASRRGCTPRAAAPGVARRLHPDTVANVVSTQDLFGLLGRVGEESEPAGTIPRYRVPGGATVYGLRADPGETPPRPIPAVELGARNRSRDRWGPVFAIDPASRGV